MPSESDANNTEPSTLEAGSNFVSEVIRQGYLKELQRRAYWQELATQQAQTVVTKGTELGHMRTVIRAKDPNA